MLNTNLASSRNYDVKEYCTDVIETVMEACDQAGAASTMPSSKASLLPDSSVLVFNILDAGRWDALRRMSPRIISDQGCATCCSICRKSLPVFMSEKSARMSQVDGCFCAISIGSNFVLGHASLRDRAVGESLLWPHHLTHRQRVRSVLTAYVPEDRPPVYRSRGSIYYANFSVCYVRIRQFPGPLAKCPGRCIASTITNLPQPPSRRHYPRL